MSILLRMKNLLRVLDHLPRHLREFMRGAQGAFAHLAEHLREFEQLRLARQALNARQRAVALNQLLHLIMFIAEDRQLRQVRHTKDLMVASEMPELETDHEAHTSADALIDFIEDQRWDLVGAG